MAENFGWICEWHHGRSRSYGWRGRGPKGTATNAPTASFAARAALWIDGRAPREDRHAEEGREELRIDLHGELASIENIASQKRARPGTPANGRVSGPNMIGVVAGLGFGFSFPAHDPPRRSSAGAAPAASELADAAPRDLV
jgi:hypothetical protein